MVDGAVLGVIEGDSLGLVESVDEGFKLGITEG